MIPGGWEWVIIALVVLLLFGAKKLPEMARSVGQSARVFKGEMKGMKADDETRNPATPNPPAALPPAAAPPPAQPQAAAPQAAEYQPGSTEGPRSPPRCGTRSLAVGVVGPTPTAP